MPATSLKAYATIGIVLKTSTDGSTYTELCHIKSFPALGGSPDQLETTDLQDTSQTFVLGVQSMDSMEFTCNYNYDDYKTVHDLVGTGLYYKLELPDGEATWQGQHSVWVGEGSVNSVIDMTIAIAPSTAITVSRT